MYSDILEEEYINQWNDRVQKQTHEYMKALSGTERKEFSINSDGTICYLYGKKEKEKRVNTYLILYSKVKSRKMKDLSVKDKNFNF